MLRKGKTNGAKLTEEQIARLDGIGMVWKTKPEQQWDKGYEEAKAYYDAYGNLNVPVSYVSPSGYKLGHWIVDRREKGKAKHSIERQEQLNALGMVWVKPDSWEVRYGLAKAYYEEFGNLNIPSKYRADGVWLAKWVNEQKQIYAGKRRGKTLREDQVRRLEAIGLKLVRHGYDKDSDNCSQENPSQKKESQSQKNQDAGASLGVLTVNKKNNGNQGDVRRIGCEGYQEAV